jgi:tyrosyl-tRNA synthetase
MILQAYDFVELNKRTGCILQMGGSDQWGNIVNGIDLGHRMSNVQLYALTSPLLTTSSGGKMGKTASGAVWLNAELMGAYDFWQFWRNTEDADVERFLKLYTTMPMAEIAKKVLATEVTAMLHGREAADAASETARKTFEDGALADDLPSVAVARSELEAGLGVLTAFVKAGLVPSTGEARRQVKAGGLRVNDAAVTDERATLTLSELSGEGVIKLSFGRKKHVLLRAQ